MTEGEIIYGLYQLRRTIGYCLCASSARGHKTPSIQKFTTLSAHTYQFNSDRKLWKQLRKYLGNVAAIMDAAAQCMLDMPNKQYLTTKSFLKSAQWKFAHKSENPEDLDNVPLVVARDSQYQAHLPGINCIIIDASLLGY